jgi:hypothetical protein
VVAEILDRWHQLELPDCWLVAGCLFQTIWNLRSGNPPEAHIRDYDVFYFDAADRTAEGERRAQERTRELLGRAGAHVEVANQARVHLWYEQHFGVPYPKLRSAHDGIDRFLVLETCVGLQPDALYAPNGLEGVYAGTLTPNPARPYAALFNKKVDSYCQRWSWLRVKVAVD